MVQNPLLATLETCRDPIHGQPHAKRPHGFGLCAVRPGHERVAPFAWTCHVDRVLWEPESTLAGELDSCRRVVFVHGLSTAFADR
jgi:hypothetical protein